MTSITDTYKNSHIIENKTERNPSTLQNPPRIPKLATPLPQPLPNTSFVPPVVMNQEKYVLAINVTTSKNNQTYCVHPVYVIITGRIINDKKTYIFLCPSITRNKYLLVLYDYESDYTVAVSMLSNIYHKILLTYKIRTY